MRKREEDEGIMRRVSLIGSCVAALTLLPVAASSNETGPAELSPLTFCGAAMPAYFLNPGDVAGMFGATPGSMTNLFTTDYADDLARVCRERPALVQMMRSRVAAICFAAAAGVDEPHPYVAGKWLVIEVHPDAYARAPFRRNLARAIERGSVGAPGYDCAPKSEGGAS
jgi:hypothetical protein